MKARKLLFNILASLCFGFSVFALTSCGEIGSDSGSISITSNDNSSTDSSNSDISSEEVSHVHNWNEIKRTEATCTEGGKITYLCPECEEIKDVIIEEAKGHNEVIDEAVEATCTSTGLTEGSHCSTCNEVLVKPKEVAMKEHEWSHLCGECGQINKYYYTKGLEFKLDSDRNGYSVSVGTASDTEIIIPSFYNELPVTSIDVQAFEGCSSLTSITIPDGVTSIGYRALYKCSSLTSITIPNSVTSIGWDAFYGCGSLTNIIIPDSVISIGSCAFQECSSLTSITIPDSVTKIESGAFLNCKSLTSVTIPNSVTSIGDNTFRNCKSLTSFAIPDSVKSIGDGAFYGCSSLTSITIPDSVKSIGDYAFYDCRLLTSISIPNSLTSIGEGAFLLCFSLTDIYYTGNEEQWNSITIKGSNEKLTNATIHYNYKG